VAGRPFRRIGGRELAVMAVLLLAVLVLFDLARPDSFLRAFFDPDRPTRAEDLLDGVLRGLRGPNE